MNLMSEISIAVYKGAIEQLQRIYSGQEYLNYAAEDPIGLELLIKEAIDRVAPRYKRQVRKREQKLFPISAEEKILVLATLATGELTPALLHSFEIIENLVQKFPGNHFIFFVGAGISFDSGFNWETVMGTLASFFVPNKYPTYDAFVSAFKDDMSDIFSELQTNPAAVEEFQQAVCDAVASPDRIPHEAHRFLAWLLKKDAIEQLVCFNWDDYIEQAHHQEFGAPPKQPIIYFQQAPGSRGSKIWKPHGCVTRANTAWVYPDKGVVMNPAFDSVLGDNRHRARIVICLGFGGTPAFDLQALKQLIGVSAPYYDVRPQLKPSVVLGDEHICTSAGYVLRRLRAKLSP
jgi:hypothetical protein